MRRKQPEQNNYKTAFEKAADILRKSDIDKICLRSGAQKTEEGIALCYFNKRIVVRCPEISFDPADLPLYEQILILHYLISDGSASVKGEYTSFRNLPDASFYGSTYRKRGPARILDIFGEEPESILEACLGLGGSRAEFDDLSVRFDILPRIEAVVILYRGDDEFPPEAGILYRDDIINYLPLEDIAVLAGLIASRLKRGKSAAGEE